MVLAAIWASVCSGSAWVFVALPIWVWVDFGVGVGLRSERGWISGFQHGVILLEVGFGFCLGADLG